MSMYEALLYFLYVPFANEYMEVRRRRFAGVDSRGPRFLYIYGPSHNGKTTFLRFALKLICGQRVEPLMPSSFSKTTALTAMAFGSVFPLVFDDLTPSRRSGPFEEIVKSFWEAWWQPGHPSPQLIVSSNTESLKDWAKSRVKRVDFDVYFAPNETNKERLQLSLRSKILCSLGSRMSTLPPSDNARLPTMMSSNWLARSWLRFIHTPTERFRIIFRWNPLSKFTIPVE